ncbi:hypothetical protein BDV38DRAFT_258921 [Aspergillus pseudotamarii]|uniref:Uncharacterized protein n=1 Tax=Aspergillus pseudotamarii TaxID=132259 RepID=A0A5N6SHR9_ASPPS|nr:uncharacterized protein BDV38DRAFT_258921 [Aspergillus pseudotamarii]KAE8133280.1 hypothetical protein BDV38DRAFT_258921 [Aspergillus pseudotamarii]
MASESEWTILKCDFSRFLICLFTERWSRQQTESFGGSPFPRFTATEQESAHRFPGKGIQV